jgi:preprotein translocase subunit SecA
MFKFISSSIGKLFGTKHERDVKQYMPVVEQVNREYARLNGLTNDQLRQRTLEFRQRIKDHLSGIQQDIDKLRDNAISEENLGRKELLFDEVDALLKERDKHLEDILREIMPEAFAVVKETARRFKENETLPVTATDHDRELAATKPYLSIEGDTAIWQNRWTAAGGEVRWDMLHYDVQLIGGMVLHDGKIAEMATGEGKTLVATLPAYLNGLSGQGVHVVTVNDYLARRDAEWIGPIMEFLMLTIDCIDKYQPHSEERQRAYQCDITYGTNNEFGFDYLRDNMVRSKAEMVQRKHHYAMIDEVDSILIDDARTPLIISGPVPKGDEQEYQALKPKVEILVEAQRRLATHYLTEAKKQFSDGIMGYEEGEAGLSLLRSHRALPKNRPLIKFLAETGVKVELQKAENHYMQEQSKNMHLVDEPLLFTIDEKNNLVELTEKGAEFLSKGEENPNFFILPDITHEIMEIDSEEGLSPEQKAEKKNEAVQDYSLKASRLHTINQLLKAYALFERDDHYVVIEGEVKIVDEQTGRIMEGRRYSDGLHQALEAKEGVKVGDITQTYATITLQNYFRMYHKLSGMTGTAETEASEFWEIYKLDVTVIPTNRPITRKDMEDLVYKTEREKFNAVVEEVARLSQAGRPVLVGTTSVEYSEKLSRILNMRGIKHNVLNAKQHQREAQVVAEAGHAGNVTIATNMAGRGTDIKISDEVKRAGGLAIVGTTRHDSRRVDRQLRGRAGRQGDPGSSQFFVSLDDQLMRLFRSERIAKMMDRFGHQDGEVIQHSMVTKSIERAQKRMEENNFGIRKRLLEYDDVMNIQREAIYKKRANALSGERLSVDLNNMFLGLTEELLLTHRSAGDYQGFREEVMRQIGIDPDISEAQFKSASDRQLVEAFQKQVLDYYKLKTEHINKGLLPAITQVYENEGHRYKRIMIPFTDGRKRPLAISANLEAAVNSDGKSIMRDIEKTITLALIDDLWKEHLRSMDDLKESVQAASFEQKDPLVIYKMEAYNYFEHLMRTVNRNVVSYLMRGAIEVQQPEEIKEAREQKTDYSKTQTNRLDEEGSAEEKAAKAAAAGASPRTSVSTVRRHQPKVGRNDLCPCGSGKKYKHCHGA